MASTFPNALDTIPDSPTIERLGVSIPTHPEMHDLLRDAIVALESHIGVSGSTDTVSVNGRLSNISDSLVPSDPNSSTVYMFRNPITLSSSLVSDQREIYIPNEMAGVYLGAFFGKRIKANTAETLTDLGLFRAGLHTWHGSLTKVGSWVTSPANQAAGAFQSTGCSYSLTAGDTISGTVNGTAAAIRVFLTTVGGYGIVSIDGDWTRANKLPLFDAADYSAGRCRSTDVGKRYYTSHSGATSSDLICLAADLSAGAHTIVVEATGTKHASSSGARCYVEGFAGCNGETLSNANVYAVPVQWIYHDILNWSAFGFVTSWAPTGSVDYQFLGDIHGDGTQSKEVTTSGPTWFVNVTDQTALAQGSWASGQVVRCDHVSTLAHKVNTAITVATRTRRWVMAPGRKHQVMLDISCAWASAGVVNIEYPVMLPIGEAISYLGGMKQDAFTSAVVGTKQYTIPSAHDNSVTYVATDIRRLIATGAKVKAWAEVVSETPDRAGMYASSGGSMQDRSGKDKKLYTISAFGPQPYASGDVQRFVVGWGAKLL
jgi:hypothetical protein